MERLARKYLRRPVVINIGSAGKSVDRITQRIVIAKDNEKPGLLERELECAGAPLPEFLYKIAFTLRLVSHEIVVNQTSCLPARL